MKKSDVQQKYLEFQIISQQLSQLNQQVQMIDSKINELKLLEEGLDELNSMNTNQEILVPFGPGILVKASIKETKEVLMNVGANVVVKKTSAESKKFIEGQVNELQAALEETEHEIVSLSNSLKILKKEIQSSDE